MRTERAAGAVIWRGDESRPEVAVVHRPRYGDWSFPKGKLERGEHPIAAALREVREETGLAVTFGRALPPVRYPHRGGTKRVDYWTARVAEEVAEEAFVPDDEVDELRWLPADRAYALLTYERDAALLDALAAAPLDTVPLLLVRHASAGSRLEWRGDDARRPLDDRGREQARTLATVLPAYRPRTLLTSPALRCVQTLEPYGAEIVPEPLLSEEGRDPGKTPARVAGLAGPAVVCSHGEVLPPLLAALTGREEHLDKGAFAVLHRVGARVVAQECHDL